MLHTDVSAQLDQIWGPHPVDRFANVNNRQIKHFNSRIQDHLLINNHPNRRLLSGIQASYYTPVHSYNILVITHVLGLPRTWVITNSYWDITMDDIYTIRVKPIHTLATYVQICTYKFKWLMQSSTSSVIYSCTCVANATKK